jgi:hypothetical protein
LFSYPFKSLVFTPITSVVPLWKIVYIWLHVALVLAGIALLARRNWIDRFKPGLDLTMFAWLAGNTAFILCVGHIWGFHAFHRFVSWSQPALIAAYLPWLPRRPAIWALVALVSMAIAIPSILHN